MVARKIAIGGALMLLALSLCACGGPEEKKAKFYAKAKELYAKGDTVKARLEVKNAIQIDPKFAEAYLLLGLVEQKDGNLKAAFGAFSEALELNPELTAAQVELGKLFLLLAHADPAGDQPGTALALGATFTIAGPGGRREVPASEFFVDYFTTAVGPDEVLVSVSFPKHTGWGAHYEKLNRTAQAWAIVGVAATVRMEGGSVGWQIGGPDLSQ